jgi:hypothetical protein
MTTARVSEFVTGGITVKAVVADPLACDVVAFGSKQTLSAAGIYGINGTFFSTTDTIGIAVTAGAVAVTSTSNSNNYNLSGYHRGTLIVYNHNWVPDYKVEQLGIITASTIDNGNIHWAIGGISLYLGKTYTDQQYIADVNANETADGVSYYDLSSQCKRSAIGYRLSDNKIIMIATSEATVPQVRNIMKDYIGCNDGIMLDSNPSTEIRGIRSDSTLMAYGNNNSIYTAVKVNPTSWV